MLISINWVEKVACKRAGFFGCLAGDLGIRGGFGIWISQRAPELKCPPQKISLTGFPNSLREGAPSLFVFGDFSQRHYRNGGCYSGGGNAPKSVRVF